MIELLSLPRRPKKNIAIPSVKLQSGLPINSLPGWEHIPLNLKLPMLKCPGNQVIFSKNKIGQSSKRLKHDFDTSGNDSIPEYNPLHDSNLKTFYANERNLKRLRENGEITLDNDVICNLKAFNEHRQHLHKSHLYYMLQEMNRLDAEQQDRLLISNAESITNRDHQRLSARDLSCSKIMYRKALHDQQRRELYRKLYDKTLERIAYIEMIRTIDNGAKEHKKILKQLKFQKHADVRCDIQRKQLISLKKLFQFKKERLQKNLRKLEETRREREEKKQIQSWGKRLAERIANEEKVRKLHAEANMQRKLFIENHQQTYKEKWDKIQQEIKAIAAKNRKDFKLDGKEDDAKKNGAKTGGAEGSPIELFRENFETLLDSEVCEALNTAIDLENKINVPLEPGDPICKAAQYIMEVILKNFHKDLSLDKETFKNVSTRINKFFDEAKNCVIFRATQIIASLQDHLKTPRCPGFSRISSVSFNKMSSTIGMSSYNIHPLIEIKKASKRQPTPAGSLTSIIVHSTLDLVEKSNCCYLSRNELVFIEHYIVKWKRELIVGIGRKVFAAIECHFAKKVLDVRQELLDIDRKFLVNQVTKSILSYAVNPLNFTSILKLCISALSSDIIWSLQKQLLKPNPDRRRVVKPSVNCSCRKRRLQLCLFCNEGK